MGQCKELVTISTIYDCAVFCKKWNNPPIPKFIVNKNFLIQDCVFFDSGVIQERLFKWIFKCSGSIIYESSWGGLSDNITEMNNGSTYGSIKLGFENIAIVNFINSLPFTLIDKHDTIEITLSIKDCDGITNKAQSNRYKFNKK